MREEDEDEDEDEVCSQGVKMQEEERSSVKDRCLPHQQSLALTASLRPLEGAEIRHAVCCVVTYRYVA